MMMFDKPISMEELTDAADELKVLELVSIQAYKKRMRISNAKMSLIKGGKNK